MSKTIEHYEDKRGEKQKMTTKQFMIVFVDGQKRLLADVKEQFSYLSITKTAKRILTILLKSSNPLTRVELTQKVNHHPIQIHKALINLIHTGLVFRFTQHSRAYYYVLTKKGYDLIKMEEF